MEVLACPHCDRLFRLTPPALGKQIRCRGCRQLFHVPRDTSNVPISRTALHTVAPDDGAAGPPVAGECVVDGRDARRCPRCEHSFWMSAKLADKVIRCRRCKATFRVAGLAGVGHGTFQQPPPPRPANQLPGIVPCIFDDIGDLIEEILPREAARVNVPSVVRPQVVTEVSLHDGSGAATVVAIVLGGACALPATQLILWWVFAKDPLGIATMLPEAVRWLAPEQF